MTFQIVDKPAGGIRRLSHLDAHDAARYASVVRPVTPRVEAVLSGGVMANRVSPRGSLAPAGRARQAWRRRVLGSVAERPRPAVAVSDVRAFYASVSEAAITAALRRAEVPDAAALAVLSFLREMWDEGVDGLPIGPEPSAVLANCVLAAADRAAAEQGVEVIRWVDDVVLVAADARVAERALAAWTRAIAGLGLQPNEAKTRLLTDRDEALATLLGGRRSPGARPGRGMMRPP